MKKNYLFHALTRIECKEYTLKQDPRKLIGCHRDLVAIGIVRVIDGIGRAALGGDAPFGVVGCGDGVAERIGYRSLAAERVIGVGRATKCHQLNPPTEL